MKRYEVIQNAKINYTLHLTHGEQKGKTIELSFNIDELEEDDISTKLIDDGYYESMGWPTDYYYIIKREIILL